MSKIKRKSVSETLKRKHKEKQWGFKKGMTPWNKGLKGFRAEIPRHQYNKKFREKISKSSKGRIPWNKGLDKNSDWRLKKISIHMELENPMKQLSVKKKVSMTSQGIFNEEEWKGFISGNYDKAIEFRNQVRQRDNNQCLLCGKKQISKLFSVHHIEYDNNHNLKFCVTLCNSCHSKTNWNRNYWTNYFKQLLSKNYGYKYEQEVKNVRIS